MSARNGKWGGCAAIALIAALAMESSAQAQERGAAPDESSAVEEIVVTANKREQSANDVAASLSALSGRAIEDRGISDMGDYLASVPSVAFQSRGPARSKVVIRGVSSGVDQSEEPTTGVYIGETPISGIGQFGVFDPKLVDVGRIEILRGPQGTLYGAGSMGGALKILPAEPDLSAIRVKGEAAVYGTDQAATSFDANATINLPLVSDVLAIRATAYHYDVSGFVDNVYAGNPIFGVPAKTDTNVSSENTTGARVIVAFRPSPEFHASLTALVQDTQTDGVPEARYIGGRFIQSRGGDEGLTDNFKLLNLAMTYDFGDLELTSATSLVRRRDVQARSVEAFIGVPVVLRNTTVSDFFAQELRLAGTTGDLSWIVGGYYSNKEWGPGQRGEWFGSDAGLNLLGASFGLPPGFVTRQNIFVSAAELKESQIAAFADATYAITPKLDLAVGLRWFRYEQNRHQMVGGLFNGFVNTDQRSKTAEDKFTPRVNISYKPNDDQLIYAQAAKGFRVGRVNLAAPNTCDAELTALGLADVPVRSNSDGIWSYEAGTKISAAGGRLQVNAAAFYIDWTNIQTNALLACGFEFYSNAGKASNRGVELEITGRVTDELTLSLSGSYNDAHLNEDAPLFTGSGGRKGDRLPGVPRYNLLASAEYRTDLGGTDVFARADLSYVGDYFRRFAKTPAGRSGDYALLDLRGGVDLGRFNAELFVSNLTNKRAILFTDIEDPTDSGKIFARPRTIGARLRFTY
jgi:iron complex outermembrane receptor protein